MEVKAKQDQESGEAGKERRAAPSAEVETHLTVSTTPSFTPGPWRVDAHGLANGQDTEEEK